MTDQLAGRTVFITGSGGVLGSTYVRRMLDEGARVIASDLAGHRADALKAAHESIANFRFYELDVAEESQVETIFARIIADGWQPNVVLNNAAITGELLMGAGKPFPDFANTSVSDWERTLRTNLTGAFRWIRAASRGMLKARSGRIINIGSVVGLVGNAGQANYAAAKAGLIGLTQSVAREFASRGITCNCVCPGFFDTDMTSVLKEDLKSKVLTTIPLNRFGKPEEVAGLVSFLCGPDAGYVTGQAWAIDGGMTM